MMVAPMFVPQESQLSTVDDVFNGILVTGDATGEVLFYGKGAGKLPTASAVMSDVIDCAKATDTIDTLYWEDGDGSELADLSLLPSRFYLRFQMQYSQQLSWLEHSFAMRNSGKKKSAADRSSSCHRQHDTRASGSFAAKRKKRRHHPSFQNCGVIMLF